MCARYELVDLLRFGDSVRFQMLDAALWGADRLDIRPTKIVPVIVSAAISTRDLVAMRWGLVPHWATDTRVGTKAINTRSEGIEDKPFFRGPLCRSRCLIPASAFFEWRLEGARKVKYRFARRARSSGDDKQHPCVAGAIRQRGHLSGSHHYPLCPRCPMRRNAPALPMLSTELTLPILRMLPPLNTLRMLSTLATLRDDPR